MNNKQCANCKQIKPLDEFFKNPTGSNGRGCYCKKCHLERKQAARKEKKGYYGSEKIKETDKKYREENHDHIKNKSKITLLKKYNVDNISKNENIKLKKIKISKAKLEASISQSSRTLKRRGY